MSRQGSIADGVAIAPRLDFAKQAVRAGESLFRSVFEAARIGLVLIDREGVWLNANRALYEALGRCRDEFNGRGLPDLIAPGYEDVLMKARAALERTGVWRGEIPFLRADGTAVTLDWHCTALAESDVWLAVATDVTDRKRAAEELRDRDERYERVVAGAEAAIWDWNVPEKRVDYSPRWKQLRGFSDAEVSDSEEEWSKGIHPDDVDRVMAAVGAHFAGRTPFFAEEYRVRHKQGHWIWILDRGIAKRNAAGQVLRMAGSETDITKRKEAEDALRQSEERLRLALEAGRMGVWDWDVRTDEVQWSENLESIHGLAPGSFQGTLEAFRQLIHPEDRVKVQEAIARSVRERCMYDIEFRNVWPDGTIHWMAGKGKVVCGRGGLPERMVGVAMNVDHRKAAEETVRVLLRVSKRLNSTLDLDELLDILVQEAITLIGAEAGVSGLRTPEGMACKKYFQKGSSLPLDYCWPPMHGLPGWLLVHKVPYLTNDALHDPQIVHELCVQFGVHSALSTPIITAQGEVIGFFEIHNKQDAGGFTESDQELLLSITQTAAIAVQNALAYRAVQQAQENLKAADRRKDEFLATLAHELRNPLAPIRSGVDLLKLKKQADPDHVLCLEIIDRQTENLTRLVDDLLEVSRITRGKIELKRELVALSAVLASAVEASRSLIEGSNHQLVLDVPPDGPWLFADPTRLAQVFTNLLNNAAKYTPQGGEIWLSATVEDRDAVVTLRDTGIGISADDLPRVFEMFSQVNPALSRSQGGLGIGLALVKALVELHEGTVQVDSAGHGRGSQFTVRLPIAEISAAVSAVAEGPNHATKPVRGCRVLVVDDNPDVVSTLAMMLRAMGHEIHTAHDGQEALAAAESLRPEVILLDIGLPKMNGYDVARRIRNENWGRDIVLIAQTGWGQEADRRRAEHAGFDHHLTKPIHRAALAELLTPIASPSPGATPG